MSLDHLDVVTGYAGLEIVGMDGSTRSGPGPTRPPLLLAVTAAALLVLFVAAAGAVRFGSLPAPDPGSGVRPIVAITSPGASGQLIDGAPVRIDALDGGGEVRVDLFIDGDWVGTDSTPPYTPSWEHRSEGRHELKAKVTDAEGQVRYSQPVEVEITG